MRASTAGATVIIDDTNLDDDIALPEPVIVNSATPSPQIEQNPNDNEHEPNQNVSTQPNNNLIQHIKTEDNNHVKVKLEYDKNQNLSSYCQSGLAVDNECKYNPPENENYQRSSYSGNSNQQSMRNRSKAACKRKKKLPKSYLSSNRIKKRKRSKRRSKQTSKYTMRLATPDHLPQSFRRPSNSNATKRLATPENEPKQYLSNQSQSIERNIDQQMAYSNRYIDQASSYAMENYISNHTTHESYNQQPQSYMYTDAMTYPDHLPQNQTESSNERYHQHQYGYSGSYLSSLDANRRYYYNDNHPPNYSSYKSTNDSFPHRGYAYHGPHNEMSQSRSRYATDNGNRRSFVPSYRNNDGYATVKSRQLLTYFKERYDNGNIQQRNHM